MADREARDDVERWLRRRGLPLLVEGRTAQEDVWTRAAPFLVVVFLAQSFNALNADWPTWANVFALLGGVGVLLGAWAALNVARGRPAAALPRRVGVVELTVFVLVPPLLPVIFGGQVGAAGATIVGNLVLLGLVYVVVDLGLVSMVRWAFVQLGRQVGDVLAVVVRALPLLLLFVTFLFVNAEAWQVASSLPWAVIALVGGLFAVIAALFAGLRVPRQIRDAAVPLPPRQRRPLLAGTPVASTGIDVDGVERTSLSRRQRGNVGLVILVSEGVQVLVVTLALFGFFALFGFLAMGVDVIGAWIVGTPEILWTLTVGGHEFVLTEELLKVATFLAAFSGLYFTVSLLTDATYREEFLDEIVDEMRRSLLVRDVHLATLRCDAAQRGRGSASATTGEPSGRDVDERAPERDVPGS